MEQLGPWCRRLEPCNQYRLEPCNQYRLEPCNQYRLVLCIQCQLGPCSQLASGLVPSFPHRSPLALACGLVHGCESGIEIGNRHGVCRLVLSLVHGSGCESGIGNQHGASCERVLDVRGSGIGCEIGCSSHHVPLVPSCGQIWIVHVELERCMALEQS
jgi:hypothetical protein